MVSMLQFLTDIHVRVLWGESSKLCLTRVRLATLIRSIARSPTIEARLELARITDEQLLTTIRLVCGLNLLSPSVVNTSS